VVAAVAGAARRAVAVVGGGDREMGAMTGTLIEGTLPAVVFAGYSRLD
jgi:hypothetical protein